MEITSRKNQIKVGENRGIIRHGVDFGGHHFSGVVDGILRRTMNLRYATERIRILHIGFGLLLYLAAFEESADIVGGLDHAFVGTHLLEAVAERGEESLECIQRQSANKVGLAREATCAEQSGHGVGGHKLCTVEQRKSLLAFKGDGFETQFL